MKRALLLTVVVAGAAMLTSGCREEHGRAPLGQFEPGGPVDQRGNSATTRALEPQAQAQPTLPAVQPLGQTLGSAEPPAPFVNVETVTAPDVGNLYDAGGEAIDPAAQPVSAVTGRVTQLGPGTLQLQPEGGQPVQLATNQFPEVTLDGTLISQQAITEGALVRASYRQGQNNQQIADTIEVINEPQEGRGLEPLPSAPAQQAAPKPLPQPPGTQRTDMQHRR